MRCFNCSIKVRAFYSSTKAGYSYEGLRFLTKVLVRPTEKADVAPTCQFVLTNFHLAFAKARRMYPLLAFSFTLEHFLLLAVVCRIVSCPADAVLHVFFQAYAVQRVVFMMNVDTVHDSVLRSYKIALTRRPIHVLVCVNPKIRRVRSSAERTINWIHFHFTRGFHGHKSCLTILQLKSDSNVSIVFAT